MDELNWKLFNMRSCFVLFSNHQQTGKQSSMSTNTRLMYGWNNPPCQPILDSCMDDCFGHVLECLHVLNMEFITGITTFSVSVFSLKWRDRKNQNSLWIIVQHHIVNSLSWHIN